jgi:Cu2+-exporting ATPase
VQRLDGLEALATTRHVFFDKTGTLTEDRPQLAGRAWLADGEPAAAVDAAAAALAGWSRHPLSQALVAGLPPSVQPLHDVSEVPGQGLRGVDEAGTEWRLGTAAWAGATAQPGMRVWLARGQAAVAGYAFDETPREGAAEAVSALRAEGVRVTLLSGDADARAAALAARLGIDEVIAGASPEAKLSALAEAQRAGHPVGMVGDGVNDGPVLARADVSVAMGQGALVARSQADAVIVSNRLGDIVAARQTAQRALGIVRQNLLWAALYNAACIPLAVAGWLPPWAAGLGMAASSLFVVVNAARAGR